MCYALDPIAEIEFLVARLFLFGYRGAKNIAVSQPVLKRINPEMAVAVGLIKNKPTRSVFMLVNQHVETS